MKRLNFLTISSLLLLSTTAVAANGVEFPSADGLTITADLYLVSSSATSQTRHPMVVLFHQAGWSRGEYKEIAPRLNQMGFNALAVDLRSGKSVNGVTNATARRAREQGKATNYLDALPDIEAALRYARGLTGNKVTLIAWGSSYSSALVLQIAGTKPELADAILSFSPGEYFHRAGKPIDWVQKSAAGITKPVFITSARSETKRWSTIFESIPSTEKTSFIPATPGHHGSRALWSQYVDSEAYWDAVSLFLEKFLP